MSREGETWELPGAQGPVKVRRGAHGVPRIRAASLNDALFGLGYCHALDRSLAMRLMRILARGRACEVLGDDPTLLDFDRFFRRWNFGHDVEAEEAKLTPATRAAVESYGHGVDLATERHGIPWELKFLGDRDVSRWTFADVALLAKTIGFVTLANTQAELERWIIECVQAGVDRARLEELFPGLLQGLDVDLVKKVRLPERVVPAGIPWKASASNSWAVAGSRTASGSPLLCCDPHLEVSRLPAFWYEAALHWTDAATGEPGYALGFTLPGTPGIVFGRTRNVAWGVTYAFMDCVDSWIEDCRNGMYRRGTTWHPFQVRRETIRRKGQDPIDLILYENEHGILSGNPHVAGYYLATRWTGNEDSSASSVESFLAILAARTADEGRTVLGSLRNASWNWTVADRAGSIGYQMSGRMPIRRKGRSGLLPLPGWDPENDWQGIVPNEELPRELDPVDGILVTANDDLNELSPTDRQPINVCMAPDRAERIRVLLDRKTQLTPDDMKEMLRDVRSKQALRFLDRLGALLTERFDQPAARLLAGWDGSYDAESPAPVVFERFYRELIEEVFGSGPKGLGPDVIRHLLARTTLFLEFYGVIDRVLLREHSAWFGGRTRDQVYGAALDRALVAEPEPKPWGGSRQFLARHLLFGGRLPRWLGFDAGPFPLRGGRATIHQGQLFSRHKRPSAVGPSAQLIVELETDSIQTALPGGASDRRTSPWYADRFRDWCEGRLSRLDADPDQPTPDSGNA